MTGISGKVLITGGAGFIGSHLAERLVAEGLSVTAIDDLSSGSRENLAQAGPRCQLIVGKLADVLAQKVVDLAEFDYVFHLAANAYVPPSVKDPLNDFHTTLHNTVLVLEELRKVAAETPDRLPLLVNMSSAAVYGNPVTLPIVEDSLTVPVSPYGVSKLASERYVKVYSSIYKVRAVSLRLFSAYGPRQRKQVVYDLILKIRNNSKCLEMVGDGTQARDFMYVSDVVDGLMLIAASGITDGSVYNLASGQSRTIAELVTALVKTSGTSPEVKYSGSVRSGDADYWVASIEKIEKLGYRPKVSMEEGLERTFEWYDSTPGAGPSSGSASEKPASEKPASEKRATEKRLNESGFAPSPKREIRA